jgi:hypothetical protein
VDKRKPGRLPPLWWLPATALLTVSALNKVYWRSTVVEESAARRHGSAYGEFNRQFGDVASVHAVPSVQIHDVGEGAPRYRIELRSPDSEATGRLLADVGKLRDVDRIELVSNTTVDGGANEVVFDVLMRDRAPR